MSKDRPQHQGRRIEQELDLAADADRVWHAWADPQQIAQWFVDRADGFAEPGRVVKWYFEAMQVEVPQPVVEAEPGRSFVTAGEYGGRAWMLEVLLQQQAKGHTRLRLINSGFDGSTDADEQVEGIASGWQMALHTLKRWLERHADAGGRRGHAFVAQPASAPFAFARLLPLLTTADGLSRWLGRAASAGELQRGSTVQIDLDGGGRLAGEVLCRTAREVLLSWPERQGVLGLKAFAQGPMQVLALDASSWAGQGALVDAEAWARPALQRLAAALAR